MNIDIKWQRILPFMYNKRLCISDYKGKKAIQQVWYAPNAETNPWEVNNFGEGWVETYG